ncbi:hypothetical protein [Sphingomonas sp.]|uniref:hypothetical protein n=1 Tax=Sphingomonas sp. TaxID=28214 RepID=UPI002DD64728|nr:hypothetical protein [Sphingomonas sp.]
MRAFGVGAALIAAAGLATAADARDMLYPWKPGVLTEQASADQQGCMTQAKGVEKQVGASERRRSSGQPATAPPAGSKSWLAPGIDAQTAFFNSYYDCLRAQGYSIRRMPARDYAAIRKRPDGAQVMLTAIGATQTSHAEVPPGIIK